MKMVPLLLKDSLLWNRIIFVTLNFQNDNFSMEYLIHLDFYKIIQK